MRKILLEGTVDINSFHIIFHIIFRLCGIIGPKVELLSVYTFQINVIQNIIFKKPNVKNNPKNCVYERERERENMGHHSLQTPARTLNYFLLNTEFSILYKYTMYTCCKLSISTRDSNVLLNTRIIQN
jgi:hypothetical protein